MAITLSRAIGERLSRDGGCALIVDYGPADGAPGDSLQAVRGHAYHPVLQDPGNADLTAHVDFSALTRSASEAGAHVWGPVPQADFLRRLGIEARVSTLLAKATPEQADAIEAARRRLIDDDQMGTLFKAMALCGPQLPPPAGFTDS